MKRTIKIISVCIIISILASAICFTLSSCGNENMGFGNYEYNYIHLVDGDNSKCVKIESWQTNEFGIEVHLSGGGNLWCSKGTYWLSKDKCPLCND